MTRTPSRAHRGRYRNGLFNNPGVDDTEARDNPLERRCPHPPCRANVGRPCTVRGRPMRGYHPARQETTDG